MENIAERLKLLVERETGNTRRFKELEEATGIASETWRTYWNRNAKPSGDMIEAICKKWPQYALWVATGVLDPTNGHIAPRGVDTFPEENKPESSITTQYLQYQLGLQAKREARSVLFLPDHIVDRIDKWFASINTKIAGKPNPIIQERILKREEALNLLDEIALTRKVERDSLQRIENHGNYKK